MAEPDQLAALRAAMSDLERRQAEGESGFFARLDSSVEPPGSGPVEEASRQSREDSPAGNVAGEDVRAPEESLAPGTSPGTEGNQPGFEESPEFAEAYAKAKKTALNMLAMRDHSSKELREKLLGRDFDPDAVDRLITKLQRSNLLDDGEFAKRFAKAQRETKKLSRSALRRQLSKKGIDEETITEVVNDVDGEEDLARDVAEKKARSTQGLDYAVRERRILGMLARRGFSSAICLKVTREVLAES